ncbi:MAG: cation:proton antiporter [Gammaproteobacteria bacterium]|nr:monovalent cation:proton antiporter-2 (CPA2) family protein [Gammaproteobacteria bacterium]MCP5137783.1 cation:proton antiporter [Gammaproteobacteria bacterium]
MNLEYILALLATAIVSVLLFQRLGLGAILGYLAGGILLGPSGLGVIENVEDIRHLAEFGVVFLLFLIGIEMKPGRLWIMRRLVFGLGLAQLLLTGLTLALFAWWLGLAPRPALVVGLGLALSSTAFGIQVLAERGELNTETGRSAFSVLLFQDLAVVPLLALVSFFAGGTSLELGVLYALGEAVAIVAVVYLASRYLLDPLLHLIAGSRQSEVFVAAALLLVLGIGYLMEHVGLSLALGAFLAGLMLAESRFRHQASADIQPFRGLLLGLFFMAVGMTMDLARLLAEPGLLLGLTALLIAVKATLMALLARIFRHRTGSIPQVALLLSQAGEFGFVLFTFAFSQHLLDAVLVQRLTLIISLSMALTPLLIRVGDRLTGLIREPPAIPSVNNQPASDKWVLIAGFGRVGRRIARMLQDAGLGYLALDEDVDQIVVGQGRGLNVIFGDATRLNVLQAVDAGHAAALVVAFDDEKSTEQLVAIAHQHFPGKPVYVRARDRHHGALLRQMGAQSSVSENLEVSLRLGEFALRDLGADDATITALIERYREEYE